jgi:type IX secretion system PorP/SprF family membrane protein
MELKHKGIKKLVKAMLLLLLVSNISQECRSQDIHLSQFFEAPLWRNPSLAGIFYGDLRFQGVYRTQWANVAAPYITGSFNGEYKMPVGGANDFLTVGMQLMYDKAGTTNFTTTHILPAVNFHKSLSGNKNTYLSLGFMGGLVQRSIDPSKITTNSQWDGSGYNATLSTNEPLANYNLTYGDASVGMSFNSSIRGSEYDNFFVGIAYHHFNRPRNSFYHSPDIELNPKWVYSLGVKLGITPSTYLTVQADHSRQGSYTETLAGGMVGIALDGYDFNDSRYNLHFGAFFRLKDALVPVIKIDYKPFAVAFSYDVNISQLKSASQSRGGFEMSVTYQAFFDRGNTTKNAVLCPRF